MLDILNRNDDFLQSVTDKILLREKYNTQLEKSVDTRSIVVLTGLRRSGKSSILLKYLESKENIFYFSKELDPGNQIYDNVQLLEIFDVYTQNFGDPKYIVIDEVQDIKNWEVFLRYIHALRKFKIIITGSNSELLSGELSTYLGGRYTEISIYPLDYREFLKFSGKQQNKDTLIEYFLYGGLPEIVFIEDIELKKNYLKMVKDSIILKDIIARYGIRELAVFEMLMQFIADNIGNLTTARTIHGVLQSQKYKISVGALIEYLHFSCQAFIMNKAQRYDISGKKILELQNKYYLSDLGLRNALLGDFSTKNIGRILENFVYNELLKHNYEIYIGNISGKEVDFRAQKGDKIIYIQVSYILESEETLKRELCSLQAIQDGYQKIIVTLDEFALGNYEGIEIISIEEFLLLIEQK